MHRYHKHKRKKHYSCSPLLIQGYRNAVIILGAISVIRVSIPYAQEESMPTTIPAVLPLSNVKLETVINTPIKVKTTRHTFFILSFSLKKTGSKKVTNNGKVEKVIAPIATVDIWMACKYDHQWNASMIPAPNKTSRWRADDSFIF